MLRPWLSFVVLLSGLSPAAVLAQALRVDHSAETMRVDGSLREWRGASFAPLGEGEGHSLRYALASDAAGLHLAAEVNDDVLVRANGLGASQDALVLTVADVRTGTAPRVREVWLYPGDGPRVKAVAAVTDGEKPTRTDPRVRVVEGPRVDRTGKSSTGYVIEALIPWEALFGTTLWEMGRAGLRFEDVDDPRRKAVARIASSDASQPARLPRFVLGVGQQDFLASFLAAQQRAGSEPSFDVRSDVAGDPTAERVVLVDKFLLVYGPHFLDGARFLFHELPVASGAGVREVELVDLTGDGKPEITVSLRQKNALGTRELWLVLSVSDSGIQRIFSAETRKEIGAAFLTNEREVLTSGRGTPRIRLRAGKAEGVDQNSYHEAETRDEAPLLLPWGPVRARTYAYDGTRFALVDEQRIEVKAMPAAPAAPTLPAARTAASEPAPASEAVGEEALLMAFRQAAKLAPSTMPSRTFPGNLAPGKERETLYVFGTTLVFVGGDIAGGRGYLAYNLPVADLANLRYVGVADVTGDGVGEVFVRLLQPLLGAAEANRELLMILRLDGQGRVSRALTREVGRRQGERLIENQVSSKSGALVITPGRAVGWDGASYPFTDEATGGAEKLLLPWRSGALTYRLRGDVLTAE